MRDSTRTSNSTDKKAEFRVLLDSCVMFPMYLRDTLLCTVEAGLYIPYWSQGILDGATRNLVSTGKMTAERAMNLEATIKAAFPEAMVEVPVGLAEVMTNHPGDRHVLAAAIVAKAEVIVTSNLKHFKEKDLAPWNVQAQSPDAFLSDLYNLYPDLMVQVVRRQSQALRKPPRTVVELLELLSKEVPKFASKILFHEYSLGVVQTTKKALSKIGRPAPEGGRCYEGQRYKLWQQGETLTITAKDERGEILRVQDGQIEGKIVPEDINAFQIFDQRLEQELAAAKKAQHPEKDNSPLDAD
ncbi:MAG TPA: PIN domain-containing protein [Candidatus Sericytochromatia bacterium]